MKDKNQNQFVEPNKRVSSVEWLVAKLKESGIPLLKDELEFIEQAKEMEKQQIIDAFGVGCQVESTRLIGYQGMSEQYYNCTFGTSITDKH